jgi:hypothetical protein
MHTITTIDVQHKNKIIFLIGICQNCWELNSYANRWVTITNTQYKHKVYFAYHLFLNCWNFRKLNGKLWNLVF